MSDNQIELNDEVRFWLGSLMVRTGRVESISEDGSVYVAYWEPSLKCTQRILVHPSRCQVVGHFKRHWFWGWQSYQVDRRPAKESVDREIPQDA